MRPLAVLAIAFCAPGCQVVFPLEDVIDKVPHVPAGPLEEPTDVDFDQIEPLFSLDTTVPTPIGNDHGAVFTRVRQDGVDNDLVVMQVGTLRIAPTSRFRVTGQFPLVIVARTIIVEGVLDASASESNVPGPGGGRPGMDDPGQGDAGGLTTMERNASGGGGGGFGTKGGSGGAVECVVGQLGAAAGGKTHGEEQLSVLVGGGGGGNGGRRCLALDNHGGFGGGAIHLSATESISITGQLLADGGGGSGGGGEAAGCPSTDDAGGGGGAGGAIFLDAPVISNTGTIEAHGGGGGGGGALATGQAGHFGNETMAVPPATAILPSAGGPGAMPKGTTGGNGATSGRPTDGFVGMCGSTQTTFNSGGGGGAVGRIVVRVRREVSPFGSFSPTPVPLEYPVP